jgi:hypothetical protein
MAIVRLEREKRASVGVWIGSRGSAMLPILKELELRRYGKGTKRAVSFKSNRKKRELGCLNKQNLRA